MISNQIALLIYGEPGSARDALTEEKYMDLANAFSLNGFEVSSILYNDQSVDRLRGILPQFDAVLVWVNPIEQGNDRKKLDSLLTEIAASGCFVSAHPEIIFKMGTKDVLHKTKDMDWGGDIKMYTTHQDFVSQFDESLRTSGIRVLKQYRGNGGKGVYKVIREAGNKVKLIHATESYKERILSLDHFYDEFKSFFLNEGLLIDQKWNNNTINGMVRCYLSGSKVAGFGYQEINALYELNNRPGQIHFPPSKRYYFTENCGLFGDLREIMESKWVPELQKKLSMTRDMMPVIWDADFFINNINNNTAIGKYSICEINVSCVSPFPPGAVKYIVDEVTNRIKIRMMQ